MARRKLTRKFALIFGLALPFMGFCNSYEEMTLAEKVDASDIVVIAHVLKTSIQHCKPESACASIEVVSFLKGSTKDDILVLFDGPVAEMNPRCCEQGVTYLFFLAHLDGQYYRSANGPFGIYRTN